MRFAGEKERSAWIEGRATFTIVASSIAAAGLEYGPEFRGLRGLALGDGIAVAELAAGDAVFRLDPRVLDAAFQSLAAALPRDRRDAVVPSRVDRFAVWGGAPSWSVVRLRAPDCADVALFDADARAVACCIGLRLAPIGSDAAAMLEPVWQPILWTVKPPSGSTVETRTMPPLRVYGFSMPFAPRGSGLTGPAWPS